MANLGSKVDLGQSHPLIAKQAFGWDPEEFSAGSDANKAWKCELGHVWSARISDRATGSGKCPFCIGKRVLVGFNDLKTINPELANQALGWDPTTVTISSNKILNWICPKGHVWSAKLSDRTASGKTDCPVCIGKKILSGFNDLQTTHPELAKEALGWDPTGIQAGSKKNLTWRCANNHEWVARVSARALQGSGCRKCGRKSGSKKSTTASAKKLLPAISISNPELALEAFGWDPSQISIGSNKKMTWKCKKGHIWHAVVNSRAKGRGCPVCAGKSVLAGENDLATTNPTLALESQGWDPTSFTENSNKSVSWRCKLGHTWKARIASRTNGRGCPICAGQVVLAGFNDLYTTHPDIAHEALGWSPDGITAGSELKRKWRCSENHIYVSTVKDRTQGHGCPSCAQTGFDQTKDGWFYLLSHPNWGLMQLGITNVPKKRIAKHKKLGWDVVDIAGPMNGLSTRELETKSLRYLKKIKAQDGVENIAGKFDGYSESWFEVKFAIKSIDQLRKVLKHE